MENSKTDIILTGNNPDAALDEAFAQFFGTNAKSMAGDDKPKHREDKSELFPKNDPSGVIPLGASKFPDEDSKYIWLIMFYENNLTVCADTKPHYETFIAKHFGVVKAGAFDCRRSADNTRLCLKLKVKQMGLPSYGMVVNGKFSLLKRETHIMDPSTKFDDVEKFIMDKLPYDLIRSITTAAYLSSLQTSAIRGNKIGAIMYITDSEATPSPLITSLFYQYRKHFTFGSNHSNSITSWERKYKNVEKYNKQYPIIIAYIPKEAGTKSKREFEEIFANESKNPQKIAEWMDSLIKKYAHLMPDPGSDKRNKSTNSKTKRK